MSKRIELSIKLASLFGVLCGQVLFGILGDRYGRKKMFYRILIGLMVGTVFLSLVSKGAEDSLDVLALMIIWRFWMGCFIGGDYPLRLVPCLVGSIEERLTSMQRSNHCRVGNCGYIRQNI